MPRKYSGPLRQGEKSARVPKTYTKKLVRAAPKTMQNMTKLIKDIQLKEQETNYRTTAIAIPIMNHDSIHEFKMWSSTTSVFPTQGTSDGGRIGDRIFPKGIRVRMCLDVPYDRRNVKVKAYYLPYNSDQGDPTDKAQLFHNVVGNTRCDPLQFKRWKGIKYLGTFKPRDNDSTNWVTQGGHQVPELPAAAWVSSNTATIYINRFVKINKKVWFNADGSQQPSNLKENGSILLLPYCSKNTLVSDNVILASEGAFTLYYKDI
tara:strand:+ start:225 stop:1010 length:786 start_codon:yes stop_codon:yes gene_type:complete